MNFLLASEFVWNWADLVVTALGSLLGFASAIFATLLAVLLIKHFDRNALKKELLQEFKEYATDENKEEISGILADGDDLSRKIVDLPKFERAFSENRISLLLKEKYYDDLMELRSVIDDINHWYSARADYYVQNVIKVQRDKNGERKNNQETEIYEALCDMINQTIQSELFDSLKALANKME